MEDAVAHIIDVRSEKEVVEKCKGPRAMFSNTEDADNIYSFAVHLRESSASHSRNGTMYNGRKYTRNHSTE